MKRILSALGILLVLSAPLWSVGTVTVTSSTVITQAGDKSLVTVTFAWTADAAAGTVPSTAISSAILSRIAGYYLVQAITDPGSTAPTDNYDITVTDSNGLDVMGGALVDRDTANTEVAYPATTSRPIDTTLTMNLTNNSVNSATGTLKLYFAKYPIR